MRIQIEKDMTVKLPKEVAETLALRHGDWLECAITDGKIQLLPIRDKGQPAAGKPAETVFFPYTENELLWPFLLVSRGRVCSAHEQKSRGIAGLPGL